MYFSLKIDPDETARFVAFHLGDHYLQMYLFMSFLAKSNKNAKIGRQRSESMRSLLSGGLLIDD